MSSSKEENHSSFRGDFLFVDYKAGKLETLPHRKAIFSHVQKNFRLWKAHERIKHLRSNNHAVRVTQPQSSGPTSLHQKRNIAGSGTPGEYRYRFKRREEMQTNAKYRRQTANTQSLMTVLQRGQSDPFDVYPVRITPLVNKILAFYRDFALPTMFQGITLSGATRSIWRDCISSLQENCSAFCVLARCAAVALFFAPGTDMAGSALVYRTKATTLLRQHLSQGRVKISPQLLDQISALFNAEVTSRNLPAALTHGRMLVALLADPAATEAMDMRLLVGYLCDDINLSSMFLIRPLFDYENWVPKVFDNLMLALRSHLPILPDQQDSIIDQAVDGTTTLQSIFRAQHEDDAIMHHFDAQGKRVPIEVAIWLTLRVYFRCAKILAFYVDALEPRGAASAVVQQCRKYRYMAVATLHFIRHYRYACIFTGGGLYDTGPAFSGKLRLLLEEDERSLLLQPPGAQDPFRNARLWALYVGAQVEKMAGTKIRNRGNACGDHLDDGSDAVKAEGWFTAQFVVQTRRMGLYSWNEVFEILRRFSFPDDMRRHGFEWVFHAVDFESVP